MRAALWMVLGCAASWPAESLGETVTASVATTASVAAAPVVAPPPVAPGPPGVRIVHDAAGYKLQVEGRDFMVFGMNWGYMPIGQNYSYDFWAKPDDFIEAALEPEMTLLKDMGVNVIRQYVGIPARWIEYIHKRFGIYTVLNHPMGRYGFTMDGVWIFPTNYEDPEQRAYLKREVAELVEAYKGTPGLLFWLLGNENNYGLFWSSTEIEDLPQGDQADARAVFLYTLYGEIIDDIHARDQGHPVAIANGDLQFVDLIKKYAPNLDILGSNVYRGKSSRDLFQVVQDKLQVPFVYTEFGSDAYNAKEDREDHMAQAEYLKAQWEEIYEQSYGKGGVGNAIGGMVFQWSDGWWKYQQESNLDVHDTNASWATAAYAFDYVEGANNMNEEWFGICAKGPTDARGLYEVYPRTAYYVLQQAFALDPYAPTTTPAEIRRHFDAIHPERLSQPYEVQRLQEQVSLLSMVRAANVVLELSTFTTGGRGTLDVNRNDTRFDHMQSVYADLEVQPFSQVSAKVSLNVLGHVAANPIDEIYFEKRGLPQPVQDGTGATVDLPGVERIKLYQASLKWSNTYFDLDGFYRVGHGHWGYEGDFFGLYPEAYYQPSVDMFNANTPSGFVVTGKRAFEGLKVAFGPELWWGANPTLLAKYYKKLGDLQLSVVHQEDIAKRADAGTSSVLPVPRTRKTAVYLGWSAGALQLDVGGIMAGTDRLGWAYQAVRAAEGATYLDSGYYLLDDEIRIQDTFGGKVKLTYTGGRFNFYVQGGLRGLVADGGPNPTLTFTGWGLKESGQGNNYHVLGGALFNLGSFQVAPNFLYQKPLEGPVPLIEDYFDPATGNYYPAGRPRNQFSDPFWVRSNRETVGLELLLGYDPTPATWMWAWNALEREDAPFAAMVDFTYRFLPTTQDAGVAIAAEGYPFAFAGAPSAHDLWEVRGRIFVNPAPRLRLVSDLYAGIGQANGIDERIVKRAGVYARMMYDQLSVEAWVKINDWGPYDYHRDFNLTYPLQLIGDVGYSVTLPQWFVRAYTRMGVRAKYRILDEYSNRAGEALVAGDGTGREWEVMTYVQIGI
ncbi:MAG: hypothetical protein H6730_14685 [Deltaproteobacteria bacterium]|nr:hypothetical protein [Deltaproteobacteria bacterium]